MIKVIIESPYTGDVERNLEYARRCMRDSIKRGEAPFASHLLYTHSPSNLTDGDLDQVLEIENQNFPDPWGENVFKFVLNGKFKNTIAYDESAPNKVLGYSILSIDYNESHLLKMSVIKQNQLQSIGTGLMDYLFTLSDVEDREFTKMWLELRKSNEAAMKLYSNFGFKVHCERKDYYEHDGKDGDKVYEDAIMMVKNVS